MISSPDSLEWIVTIPINGLAISNSNPTCGKWQIGEVNFLSKVGVQDFSKTRGISFGDSCSLERLFDNCSAVALIEVKGEKEFAWNNSYIKIREALYMIAATEFFYGGRHHSRGFGLQGTPKILERNATLISKDGLHVISSTTRHGALNGISISQDWFKMIGQAGIDKLFSFVVDLSIDENWRRIIQRAAALFGRSYLSLELDQAFLFNISALDILLLNRGEKNGGKLRSRINGLLGWYLKQNRPDAKNEIEELYGVRNEIVHEAKHDRLSKKYLIASDSYLMNVLNSIVQSPLSFKNKKQMTDLLDEWHRKEEWPHEPALTLRWINNYQKVERMYIF